MDRLKINILHSVQHRRLLYTKQQNMPECIQGSLQVEMKNITLNQKSSFSLFCGILKMNY
jgi:hypothetical protein